MIGEEEECDYDGGAGSGWMDGWMGGGVGWMAAFRGHVFSPILIALSWSLFLAEPPPSFAVRATVDKPA